MSQPPRKIADCRQMPSESNCSLTIAGTEDEVLRVAVRHAVEDHGHEDTPELREQLRGMLREEPAPMRA
jgi:predicted small metal-binding protein